MDLQLYINNPTPTSLVPSNFVFATFIKFGSTPSLSISLQPPRQFALSPLRSLPNLNDTFSQGVHFFELITEFNPKGASNMLTCMVKSNIGEPNDYIFVVLEDGVTTWSNALPKEDT
jgi:hypothetical protein